MFGKDNDSTRILIVDDDGQVRTILHDLLGETYSCEEVGSAEAALALLRTEKFDLVLSDIMMGGVSGLEMIPHLQEIAPDTIILMISGEKTIQTGIEALKAGAFDYITKPFNLDHVEAAVRRALEHYSLRAAKRHYEEHLRLLKSVAVNANDAILITEAESLNEPGPRIVYVNEAFTRTTGYEAAEVIGKTPRILQGTKTDRNELDKIRAALLRRESVRVEIINYRKDGTEFWTELNIVPVADKNNQFTHWVSVQRETTERKQAEASLRQAHDELESRVEERTRELSQANVLLRDEIVERTRAEEQVNYLACYDTLTALPNRTLFADRLTQALVSAQRNEQLLAVIFCDIDRFKTFNDTLGHAAGDRLLCAVAERLSACVPEGETIARFGSTEFALLLTRIERTEDAAEVVQNIHETLKQPFHLDGHELYLTISSGISLYPHDGSETQTLLKNAAVALSRVKDHGGDDRQFYAADMNALAFRRLTLENDLRRALEREEFILHYQPLVDIDTGQIVGSESLVRWQHPKNNMISPGEFIPLAEQNGLIIPIGEWVLRAACAENKRWQREGFPFMRMSVNLSARQFQHPDLVGMIERILGETNLEPSYLELELTESSIMKDAEQAITTLRELKAMGIRIAIDDFGSGYSSLSYLKRFPLDTLKIDQSFIRDVTTDPNDAAIVMAIIALAHNLKLKVVAEGVETEDQLRFLRLLRCDVMQGFLFSKPIPAQSFRELLLERSHVLMEKRLENSVSEFPSRIANRPHIISNLGASEAR